MKPKLLPVAAYAYTTCKKVLHITFLTSFILSVPGSYMLKGYAQGTTRYGTSALANNSGVFNSAFGYLSMYNNTSGTRNTAHGYRSLYSNINGSYNTAIGKQSMYSNQSGNGNTAIGNEALYSNASGSYNAALGYASLVKSKGFYNTAAGAYSMESNTSGGRNTANGSHSLHSNTTGFYNTAIGRHALSSNITGWYNTALGYLADVTSGSLTNATAIGYNAKVDASNKVRIGNTFVSSIGGQVGWSTFSDGRYKKDVKENVRGLAFINNLRPVTYTVNVKGLNQYYNKGRIQDSDDEGSNTSQTIDADMKKSEDAAGKIIYNGFIAQEVEEAAKKLNYAFSGVDRPQTKDELYGLRYDNFIVPLVKAVQELSASDKEKDAKIEDLQKQISDLQLLVSSLSSTSVKLSAASLQQNNPNPVNNSTRISYNIPDGAKKSQLVITDNAGKTIKVITLGTGRGIATIDASLLSSGAYHYALWVDGLLAESRKMLVAH